MISTVHVEREVRHHPRTERILRRVPRAEVVECESYGEVFNRRGQSFRLQKRAPALILAQKSGTLVHPTPEGYGVGGARNLYFSHMLNCPYDCRYCFLQGMFRSAHQVLFVNTEDFFEAIAEEAAAGDGEAWFFSGYDCDSLAFEGVSGFARDVLDFWERRLQDTGAHLELRTKSASVAPLLEREPLANVVVAYSLSPERTAREVEHKAPPLERRLDALRRLQQRGWPVGLRFDPLLFTPDFAERYRRLFERVFSTLEADTVHSVSLGVFRLPRDFHRRLVRHYPEESLLAMPMEERDGLISYRADLERELFETCRDGLLEHIREDQYFPCLS